MTRGASLCRNSQINVRSLMLTVNQIAPKILVPMTTMVPCGVFNYSLRLVCRNAHCYDGACRSWFFLDSSVIKCLRLRQKANERPTYLKWIKFYQCVE